MSADFDDDDEVFPAEDDFDEPDALCADCGEDCFAEDKHAVECFERFGAILCEGCFNERCEEEDDGCCPSCGACPGFIGAECDEECDHAKSEPSQ